MRQIERRKIEGFDYNVAPPPVDAFRRPPAPRRNARPEAAKAIVKTVTRSPGYFASQRKYRSRKSDG